MAASTTLRLYVYIRIVSSPITLEIEFPTEPLATRYRNSVEDYTNKVLTPRQKPKTVVVNLPRSVIDLETNRSLGGFVLHFESAESASRFQDAVCRPVEDHPKQVFVKQYWDGGEGQLSARIAAFEDAGREGERDRTTAAVLGGAVQRVVRAVQAPFSDRAGEVPRVARRSARDSE